TPLFASDPRQLPYVNENQQTENRWVIDVHMQANPTIRAPQEFADQLDITLIDVDAAYPAT
ncbi:phage neck terminator protein, partial [Rhizobium sp.]|uniref:phage neck terminator protein n=1 Tax=Rhizobium sp. TaxID=391 RepID=UPI003F80B127